MKTDLLLLYLDGRKNSLYYLHILKNWSALQMVVSHSAADPESAKIATWMVDATYRAMVWRKYRPSTQQSRRFFLRHHCQVLNI